MWLFLKNMVGNFICYIFEMSSPLYPLEKKLSGCVDQGIDEDYNMDIFE